MKIYGKIDQEEKKGKCPMQGQECAWWCEDEGKAVRLRMEGGRERGMNGRSRVWKIHQEGNWAQSGERNWTWSAMWNYLRVSFHCQMMSSVAVCTKDGKPPRVETGGPVTKSVRQQLPSHLEYSLKGQITKCHLPPNLVNQNLDGIRGRMLASVDSPGDSLTLSESGITPVSHSDHFMCPVAQYQTYVLCEMCMFLSWFFALTTFHPSLTTVKDFLVQKFLVPTLTWAWFY